MILQNLKQLEILGMLLRTVSPQQILLKNFQKKFEEKTYVTNINRKLISHIKQRSYIMRI